MPTDKRLKKDRGSYQLSAKSAFNEQKLIEHTSQLLRSGQLSQAEKNCRDILRLNPNHPDALYFLGIIADQMKQNEAAIRLLTKTIAIKPDHAGALVALGNALRGMGKIDDAIENYHRALLIVPDFVDAHNNLAALLEKSNRIEELRSALVAIEEKCPDNPALSYWKAHLLKNDGHLVEARNILEMSSGTPQNLELTAAKAFFLGDLCERLGDTNAAFSFFEDANSCLAKTVNAQLYDMHHFLNRIDNLADQFSDQWVSKWSSVDLSDDRNTPVFLIGFPRSGTTLLDTILRSHSLVNVIEEKPTVSNMRVVAERFSSDYPEVLSSLSGSQILELRRAYFEEMDKCVDDYERYSVVVDKLPLNIVNVGLIHRVFPRARFIFALRHPCDCVLSCFMQNLDLNNAMVSFLNLKHTANLYDSVFSLWHQYLNLLPLNVHFVRYEEIVEDFEKTISSTLGFLGLDWDDNVRDYVKTANRRSHINTPSYNQVNQPLYSTAINRWQRYQDHLKPVLPTLLSWAKRLGYHT